MSTAVASAMSVLIIAMMILTKQRALPTDFDIAQHACKTTDWTSNPPVDGFHCPPKGIALEWRLQ
jgi:hypothetical protein